jgi:Flp pilus assembly protein TadG
MMMFTRSLARDERGASLVEMALMLPFLATIVIAMGDLSRAYSTKLQLEQAAYRAIERVQQYQSTEATFSLLKTEAVSAANDSGFSDVTASNVTVNWWLECDGVKQTNYDTVCSGSAKYARWIQVDVTRNFTPSFTPIGFNRWLGSNSDGSFTLHGRSGLRTQ